MVHTRSQISLLGSPVRDDSPDQLTRNRSLRGSGRKRRRTISGSSTSSSFDESCFSDLVRSSGPSLNPELRAKKEKKTSKDPVTPRRAPRLMKYYVDWSVGSNDESRNEVGASSPPSLHPLLDSGQNLTYSPDAPLGIGSSTEKRDCNVSGEIVSEDSSHSEVYPRDVIDAGCAAAMEVLHSLSSDMRLLETRLDVRESPSEVLEGSREIEPLLVTVSELGPNVTSTDGGLCESTPSSSDGVFEDEANGEIKTITHVLQSSLVDMGLLSSRKGVPESRTKELKASGEGVQQSRSNEHEASGEGVQQSRSNEHEASEEGKNLPPSESSASSDDAGSQDAEPSPASKGLPSIREMMAFATVPTLVSPLKDSNVDKFNEIEPKRPLQDGKSEYTDEVRVIVSSGPDMPNTDSHCNDPVQESTGSAEATDFISSSTEAIIAVETATVPSTRSNESEQPVEEEVEVADPSHQIIDVQMHSHYTETNFDPTSEVSSSDFSAESSLEADMDVKEPQDYKYPNTPSDLMLKMNSGSDCESPVSYSHSESESNTVISSESEDTGSLSPADSKIPVLYSFDHSQDSVMEVTSSTSADKQQPSPLDTSPPVLTCIRKPRPSSKRKSESKPTSGYVCPGPDCNKLYLLLYPYKIHVVHCCPDLRPTGLPLTTTERRNKINIFSAQYIQNQIAQQGAKKKNAKLELISPGSLASPSSSTSRNFCSSKCPISPISSTADTEIPSFRTKLDASRIGVTQMSEISTSCNNKCNSRDNITKEITINTGKLWGADTPMQLYKKKNPFCTEKPPLKKSYSERPPTAIQNSTAINIKEATSLSCHSENDFKSKSEKSKGVNSGGKMIPEEVCIDTENPDAYQKLKQNPAQNANGFANNMSVNENIAVVNEEVLGAESGGLSKLNSFFWEVVDHRLIKHMEHKEASKRQHGCGNATGDNTSCLNPFVGRLLSYSLPPVKFKAVHPDETPEENLAYVLIRCELNEPGGLYHKYRKDILQGFNMGRRNGWSPNPTVPRFVAKAQESVFKIPSVPARSSLTKARDIRVACDSPKTIIEQKSTGKEEKVSYQGFKGEDQMIAGDVESSPSPPSSSRFSSATGGRGEKNLKSIEDEYRRSVRVNAEDHKYNIVHGLQTAQTQSKFADENMTHKAPSNYRLVVEHLDGPPSPIFADD